MITESWCTKYTFFFCGAHSLLQAKTPINLHSGLFLKVLIGAGSASQDASLCSWGTPAKSCSMPPSSPLNAHPGAAPAPWAQCSVASIHVPGVPHLQVSGLWRETCQKLPGGLLQCWRPVRPSRGCFPPDSVVLWQLLPWVRGCPFFSLCLLPWTLAPTSEQMCSHNRHCNC